MTESELIAAMRSYTGKRSIIALALVVAKPSEADVIDVFRAFCKAVSVRAGFDLMMSLAVPIARLPLKDWPQSDLQTKWLALDQRPPAKVMMAAARAIAEGSKTSHPGGILRGVNGDADPAVKPPLTYSATTCETCGHRSYACNCGIHRDLVPTGPGAFKAAEAALAKEDQ